ncbi:MAG TPA: carboxypeptidase regulatory-like domain-containing protein [Pyrinomonadaceae bacterium]|jgi:tetratricopeptide (TPR) repeat protein|nr:carboxypeptidase regulatory-like domain-containing protein [Pyrinomonadaceae bacterium]
MRRKNYFITLAAGAMLLAISVIASAQNAPLRGHVVMTQADGTKTPVEGAIVDVFRTDIGGKFDTKTDKKGRFVFAGLPMSGTFVLSASAPNARADIIPNVKVGTDVDFELVLTPGDGKRLTLDEVKAILAGSSGAASGGSAADRRKREEMERENAELAAQNQKNVDINATISRTFKAGNEALATKRWDDALAQFKEGLAADPEQTALLVGVAEALRLRGAERYNAAVKDKDDAAKSAGIKAAQQDWRDAADAATKAAELIKKKPAATDPAVQAQDTQNRLAVLTVRTKTMVLLVSKVDPTQADAGIAAFQEYMAAETDPVKKAKAQLDLAKMLMDAGVTDKALAEYQKALDNNPDDVDALMGAGLALYNLAYASNDKAKFQEAANYLQRFVDKAPDTNPLKADAKAVLEEVKNQQNIKPERTTPARRRRQ